MKIGTTTDELQCGKDGLYTDKISLVKTLEQTLQMKTFENTLANITAEDLKIAASMFIYLNTCPYTDTDKLWLKSWSQFYTDLFQTQSADRVILTLNRMTKMINHQNNRDLKLLNRITSLLSLQFQEIQSLISPADKFENVTFKGDHHGLESVDGKYCITVYSRL